MQPTNNKQHAVRAGKWRIALATFLAIASAQLVLASHQFEHDLEGISDVCAVCLQIEQFDQPIFDASAGALPLPAGLSRPDPSASLRDIVAASHYWTRAPPRL